MFRCYFCQQITPPKTTRHSVVIEARPKQYSARRREAKRRTNFRDRDRDRDDSVQDRGGQGIEIIKEVDACPACAAKHQQTQPAMPSPATSKPAGTTEAATTEAATSEAGTN